MISLDTLKKIASDGLEFIKTQKDISDAEIFISSLSHLLSRVNYTSSIPCNGVEEPKSTLSYGIGVQAVFKEGNKNKIGFGSQIGDISIDGIKSAVEKARLSAVEDPDFYGLPIPSKAISGGTILNSELSMVPPEIHGYHDQRLMDISDDKLVELGWRALEGALKTFKEHQMMESIIIGGDVSIVQERMAIVSTTGVVAWDEAANASASMTAMIESDNAKGSGWDIGMRLSDFAPENAGKSAAMSAIHSRQGRRVPSGRYKLILGPQAVADLLCHIILPSLTLSVVDASSSTFLKKHGEGVADRRLTIYDHGAMPDLPMSRRYTCEGLATGRTDLIKKGVLTGFLSNNYYRNKVLNDPSSKDKIGVEPAAIEDAFVPRNGFRPGESMLRNFMTKPSIAPTNVIVEGSEITPLDDLVKMIGDGIYIGRIWYTYPINGLLAGDFTCTVIGDSYIIEGGRMAAPLKPNSVRIADNIHNLLNQVIGMTGDRRPTLLWGASEVIYSPDIAVRDISLHSIG